MTFPQAKICGLTTPDSVQAAVDGGAAYVGAVVFPKSPRHIDPARAAEVFAAARGRAKVAAVTVDADDALLDAIMAGFAPDLIQLHGHEDAARAEAVRARTGAGIIKALPIRTAADLDAADAWEPFVDHLMFDAKPPEGADRTGGFGLSFDWTLLADRAWRRPWFLAGGLTPDNVGEALSISGAPLVDVSSGVESAPGVKDAALIAAFLKAVADAKA